MKAWLILVGFVLCLLTGISHINLLGWFPVPFPDENQLIPFRWVCQEPSNPPQQGADGHRLGPPLGYWTLG